MLSDDELERLFQDMESDRVERKASLSDRGGIRQTICAFANDLPDHQAPGIIFVGVNDDGSCANLSITDELLRTLADMRSDGNILPFPVISESLLRGKNCERTAIRNCRSCAPTMES